MKKNALLFLLMPLAFSCAKLYTVDKNDALQSINKLIKKYQTINNVELDIVVSENVNGDKYQFAYDSKNKMFYEYKKGKDYIEKTWKYFDGNVLITLDELDKNSTVTKIKYKNSTVTPIGEQYFKIEIKKSIDANIDQLSLMLEKEKKKEEYLTHGNDLIINIDYEQYVNSVAIANDRFVSSSFKRYDSNNKIISYSEYTFNYGSFNTSVNPDEFLEV